MEEPTRLRMRRAHAKRFHVCVCGREVYGNGAKSHYRTCVAYLAAVGWPLDDRLAEDVREHFGPGVVSRVERQLGRRTLNANDPRTLSWVELRDLVWRLAAEAN